MPYGYTGQEHDDELGLVNMHGRLYDSALGQFMSADPIIQAPFSQGLNRFAYAFNSPLNYTDPSGFTAQASEDAAIGVGAGFFTGLVVHLLTSGGASGAAAGSVGAASAGTAAPSAAGAAAAGAGTASASAALAAAGVGAGIASSVAGNVIATGRQPTSVVVSTPPSTRSATASGIGQAPVGHSGYSTMATAPVQERPANLSIFAPERGVTAEQPIEPGLCNTPLFACDWEAGTMRMKTIYIPMPDGTTFVQMGQAVEAAASGVWQWVMRQRYVNAVRGLGEKVPGMREQGMTSEQIARQLHAERRLLGEQFKVLTPEKKLAEIYARNLHRYGDKLGPSIDWLRGAGKKLGGHHRVGCASGRKGSWVLSEEDNSSRQRVRRGFASLPYSRFDRDGREDVVARVGRRWLSRSRDIGGLPRRRHCGRRIRDLCRSHHHR